MRGLELFTYLPVFRALFCYAHSIIQSNDTSGLLQVFHAASESGCRNVKPDVGFEKTGEMDHSRLDGELELKHGTHSLLLVTHEQVHVLRLSLLMGCLECYLFCDAREIYFLSV